MNKILCESCFQPLEPDRKVCPCCGAAVASGKNPEGSLPLGLLLNDTYRVGKFLSLDSEGAIYDAVEISSRRSCRIKEYMPVTLCSGRAADLSLQVRVGSEVPYKNNAADFADLYGKLRHFNNDICLLGVREVFYANNTVYAVTEKAEGVSLSHYLERCGGRMGWNEALDLLDPLWLSVERMHRAGVIHRGICCDNITVTGPGVVRLGGFATQAMRSQGTELKAQLYAGYAAPEQYSASAFDGAFTDIYALCAVLYKVITGVTVPSARERLNEDTLEDPSVYANAPLPDGTVHKLPIYLADAILHGLQLEGEDRFTDMTSFRQALSGQKPHTAPAPRAPGGAVRTEPLKKNLWSRLSSEVRVGVITGAALLVVFGIVLGVWYGRRDSGDLLPGDVSSASVADTSSADGSSIPQSSSQPEEELAPSLVGLRYADARLEFKQYRYSVSYEYSAEYPAGTIIRQMPESGSPVKENSIELVISQGMEPIPLPDLEGSTQSSAESLLKSLGIQYEIVTVINDGSWATGVVTETFPAAGDLVQPGGETVVVRVAAAKPEQESSSSEAPPPPPPESTPAESTAPPASSEEPAPEPETPAPEQGA